MNQSSSHPAHTAPHESSSRQPTLILNPPTRPNENVALTPNQTQTVLAQPNILSDTVYRHPLVDVQLQKEPAKWIDEKDFDFSKLGEEQILEKLLNIARILSLNFKPPFSIMNNGNRRVFNWVEVVPPALTRIQADSVQLSVRTPLDLKRKAVLFCAIPIIHIHDEKYQKFGLRIMETAICFILFKFKPQRISSPEFDLESNKDFVSLVMTNLQAKRTQVEKVPNDLLHCRENLLWSKLAILLQGYRINLFKRKAQRDHANTSSSKSGEDADDNELFEFIINHISGYWIIIKRGVDMIKPVTEYKQPEQADATKEKGKGKKAGASSANPN